MRRVSRSWCLTLAMLLSLAGRAWAQSGTGGLQGSVLDDQKAGVPGASVTLANAETGVARTTVTGDGGTYSFVAIPPGIYKLTTELSGFRTSVVDKVAIEVDSNRRLDVTLQVGSLSESVQVVAEAPVINTTDASMGNVITGSQILALPLEARNVAGLLSLQAGVTYVPVTDPNTTMDPRYGAVSGSRADQSNVTLDGIDVNDGENQNAFTSVLRTTLDSVQEFRVSTSNYGADQGRSSGAQVSLVTRSGTNRYAGAGYWVNRDTKFSANEYFLKLAQLEAGEESQAPLLNKNIYGGAFGGPIKKDKLFFFGNFEGLSEKRETPVSRAVPSATLRDGVLVYTCANPAQCPGGTVQGLSSTHSIPSGSYGMSPAELRRVDPLGIGASSFAVDYFRQYPLPNEPGAYPGNIDNYRFAAPLENEFRTYIVRADYKATGGQTFFGRLNFQDDNILTTPQFPGKPSNRTQQVQNRGFALGHDWAIGPRAFNSMRYGYTLVDSQSLGLQSAVAARFRFIDSLDALTSSTGRELGTQNFINDFSLIRGRHTLKMGANFRWIRNDNFSNLNSYHDYVSNPSWVSGSGGRYRPGGLCPAPADCSGLPAVASSAVSLYADPFIQLLGVLTSTTSLYNYNIDGSILPVGEPVRRRFAADEYEFYLQDTWRLSETLTVSGGLRYSLFSPPYEANGVQVAPNISLGDWFEQRRALMEAGRPANEVTPISFDLAGPANDAPGYYNWDKNNFAPRVSIAWSPTQRTSIRGGYSLVYDRVGAGLATAFDSGGSFGLSTDLTTTFGSVNELAGPANRYRGPGYTPEFLLTPAPPGGFPQTFPTDTATITSSIDGNLVTPYSHVFNAVFGREIGRGFGIEAAYVGRRGRNQLVRRDLAMPLNLTDAGSGMDYFTAVRMLLDNSANGVDGMAPIPYWENLFPDAAGGGLTATQVMAQSFQDNAPDYITALFNADVCDPACSIFGPWAFFDPQYASLAARSTIGRSEYDSFQFSLRKRYSQGVQFDVNYTLARAKDHASEAERGGNFDNFGSGGYSGFLINSWEPDRNYSYSDYDIRHQVNVNYLVELPFGRTRKFGSGLGTVANALVGDWALAGIVRWTSGFPFNVINCRSCWATNWNLQGNAELAQPGVLPEMQSTRDAVQGSPSPFANPSDAVDFFRFQYPGETGIRNLLRGDGYFGIDLSLSKGFSLPFNHRLKFRWDVFNVTNTPRFDTGDIEVFPDRAASFGRYNSTLATCDAAAGRCMQVNVRYEF